MRSADSFDDGFSRRRFIQASFGAAALAWKPVRKLTPASAQAGVAPPNFPAGIGLYQQMYENWSQEIRVDDVWTATPRNAADVVLLANWARSHGWRLRPSGSKHGWAPFTVMPEQRADLKVLLVDTTANLNSIAVGKRGAHHVVTAGPGAHMDDVLVAMQRAGRGWSSIPAPGDITIAGAIAINGHGAALPAKGENTAGHSFGSVSNRVLSLDVVVWDGSSGQYKLRTCERSESITKALLTTMGRLFVTSFTLVTEPLVNLRCRTYTDIPGNEIFAAPGAPASTRTFQHFIDEGGRVEAIWFAHTPSPLLKVWSVAPTKPASARAVTGAYNYPFSDNIPLEISELATEIVNGRPAATPQFGKMSMAASIAGLTACNAYDLWGPARNTQHYIKPTTLRASDFGWAVITHRANIQRVMWEFFDKFRELNQKYEQRGQWPANMPVEVRCSGIDDVGALGIPGAEAPTLSSSTPDENHPEWDVAIWLNVLSLPDTPGAYEFKEELERWLLDKYVGDDATVRAEWCKGWAFTKERDFTNADVLDHAIPNSFRRGRNASNNWDWTIAKFNELDPHRIFTNPFVDRLLK